MPQEELPKNTNGSKKTTDKETLRALGRDRVSITLKKLGTIRQTAKTLGVSHTVLRQYLKEEGLESLYNPTFASQQARKLQSINHPRGRAGLLKWMDEHPNEKLPSGSIKDIAKATNCTIDQVKTYFHRMRKQNRKLIEKLPDLRHVPIQLKTSGGVVVETKNLDWYRFVMSKRDFSVTMVCGGKNNERWEIPIPRLDWFVSVVLKGPEPLEPRLSLEKLSSNLPEPGTPVPASTA